MAPPSSEHPFAAPLYADAYGFVTSTPTLSSDLLREGYARGLFPWTDNPIGWFCPAERALLVPEALHLPRNFAKLMRKAQFVVRADTDFPAVLRTCRATHQSQGEWITQRFVDAYSQLFADGFAHSVEVYHGEALVGGLYGVHLGELFSAESMFSRRDNAGKAALWFICAFAAQLGVRLIDVQVLGRATAALGARVLPRAQFLGLLKTLVPRGAQALRAPSWQPLANVSVASHFPVGR